MPKAAATQVIIHRIELQTTEREMIQTALAAYSFRNVSKGVFNLTSDVTTVVMLMIAYEWVTGHRVIDDALLAILGAGGDFAGGIAQSWRDYRQSAEYSEDYHERAHSVVGGFRNLLDNIIGALTGEVYYNLQNQE